jgi:hypothetical protein
MPNYYFDMKDGATVRDRAGLPFPTAAAAIEHSKDLARRLRDDPRLNEPALSIRVVDESGAEIHREQVYKEMANPKSEAPQR